jgi:hypothetical protein
MQAIATDLPETLAGTEPRDLAVYVVATTPGGTVAALEGARKFAAGFTLRVTLLVPYVVPYQLPLERPADSLAFTAERFRQLVEPLAVDVLVRVCICRPHSATLALLLPRDAVILVGGRYRRWRATREQRLAKALARDGRLVLFVRQGAIIPSCTSCTSFAAPTGRFTPGTRAILARARRRITAVAGLVTRLAAGPWFSSTRKSAGRGARRSAGNTSSSAGLA